MDLQLTLAISPYPLLPHIAFWGNGLLVRIHRRAIVYLMALMLFYIYLWVTMMLLAFLFRLGALMWHPACQVSIARANRCLHNRESAGNAVPTRNSGIHLFYQNGPVSLREDRHGSSHQLHSPLQDRFRHSFRHDQRWSSAGSLSDEYEHSCDALHALQVTHGADASSALLECHSRSIDCAEHQIRKGRRRHRPSV
ncbi:hypothetical protein PMAYCL1PPCAC_22776 [Pristionchus mayeri]|uniref:G protein-coupled receptor n=1 Tax=Pristionchus mayeri TaxID=1317129 RepID=A0AAN5CWX8_9BILA|nr:hypothetical protein PMAYCL1PPCAC_22776 [Pristionchus mayeri]